MGFRRSHYVCIQVYQLAMLTVSKLFAMDLTCVLVEWNLQLKFNLRIGYIQRLVSLLNLSWVKIYHDPGNLLFTFWLAIITTALISQ